MSESSRTTASRQLAENDCVGSAPNETSHNTKLRWQLWRERASATMSTAPWRAGLCCLALYLAFVGQGILVRGPLDPKWTAYLEPIARQRWGLVFSLLGALIFGLASPRWTPSWNIVWERTGANVGLFKPERLWLRCFIYALVLASLWFFYSAYQTHLATYMNPILPSKYPWWISVSLFVAALVALQRLERDKCAYEVSPQFTLWNFICFAVITALAAAIRLYDIVDTPVTINMDNAGAVLFAQRNLSPSFWIVPGLGVYGIPALALIFLKMSAWFTAPDVFGLRLPEAILGTLMVSGSYLLAWRAFDSHRLAALSAALLTVHAGHIHFSRHIMNLDPWTFVVFGLLLLVHGVRSQRAWALGAAGAVFSFSLHLYLSVRVLFFVAPLFAFYLLKYRPAVISKLYDGWLMFVIGAIVVVGPNFADMVIWRDLWVDSNRTGTSFLYVQTLYDAAKAHQQKLVTSFAEYQLRRVFLIPQVLRDTSGQITIDSAMFDLWIAPFLWLGLGGAVASWRKNPAMVFILLVSGTIMLVGQGLFSNIPYWPKLVFMMYAGCLWIAVSILGLCRSLLDIALWLAQPLPAVGHQIMKLARPLAYATLAALTLVVGQRQWEAYAHSARRDVPAPEIAGRFIYRLPKNAAVCGVKSSYETHVGRIESQFYAQGRTLKELGPKPALEVADQCGPRPFGWIISPDQPELKDKLVSLYPDGELKSYNHKYGQHLLWTFYVP